LHSRSPFDGLEKNSSLSLDKTLVLASLDESLTLAKIVSAILRRPREETLALARKTLILASLDETLMLAALDSSRPSYHSLVFY
jgi:hypothetical protein